MALSIIEFAVYGIIAYSSILMLIISTIREADLGKPLSIIRSIYMIPGIICASVLANAGTYITLPTSTIVNGNQTITETSQVILVNSAWILVHYMIMAILIVYVISQLLILFTKLDSS